MIEYEYNKNMCIVIWKRVKNQTAYICIQRKITRTFVEDEVDINIIKETEYLKLIYDMLNSVFMQKLNFILNNHNNQTYVCILEIFTYIIRCLQNV